MKEKGFTLIELLAVIVILAIITLIATPIVLDVINESKEKAVKETINGKESIENFESYLHQLRLVGQLIIVM